MKRRRLNITETLIETRRFKRLFALRPFRLRKMISLALAITFALPVFSGHTIAKSNSVTAPAITVNTLADTFDGSIADGTISLRDAIAVSPAGGTINFSVTGTISLALGEVLVQDRIIEGPGAGLLTIDAHQASRVFRTRGTTTLAGLTITGGVGVGNGIGGGGIYSDTSSGEVHLTVSGSVITENSAPSFEDEGGGGGIYGGPDNGGLNTVTVVNSTISNNISLKDNLKGGKGGGISGGFGSFVTIDRSTISGNTAEWQGGGVWGAATITNSTLSGNKAGNNSVGGGAYLIGNSMVANSTISGNRYDGLVTNEGCVVANSTIVCNDRGYGVTGNATLLNSIVSGNKGVDNRAGGDLGTINTGASRNNLISDAGSAGGLVDGVNGNIVGVVDAGLGALANNGGSTQTHLLFSSSLAVNAGDNSLVPNDPATGLPFTTDQTGAARIFGGGTVDMGAVEVQGTVVASTVVNTATDDVAANAWTSLSEAIGFALKLGGTVTFDPNVFATPQTIALVHGRLTLDGATINGPGASLARVDAGGASQLVFSQGVTHISGLTFTGGFTGKNANGDVIDGIGAIDNLGALTIQDCVISGNQRSGIHNFGMLVVSGSTISGNSDTSNAGGISVDNDLAITTIVNSTISGNSGALNYGGGIYALGTVTIRNSTISGNSNVGGGGGGIRMQSGSATSQNSIIAGNLSDGNPGDFVGAMAFGSNVFYTFDPASSYNLLGDAEYPSGLVNGVNGNIVGVDSGLVLGPLADNGGRTPTHALLPGSPAIDAGDPNAVAGVGNTPQYDQRGPGFARVRGGRLDIGAFEAPAQNQPPTITAQAISVARNTSTNQNVAVVADAQDAASSLTVAVEGNTTVNGVTLSNLAIDSTGNVTATVAAGGGASDASFTLKVTDSGNLSTTATLNVTVIINDTTPPVIDPVANIVVTLPANSVATSMVVTFPLPTATDNDSTPTVTTSPVSGSVFQLGVTTVNVKAKDAAGNEAASSFTITVRYRFGGFVQPVDNLPLVNVVKAGQSVPVKFSLSGNKGLNILAAGYPISGPVACNASSLDSQVEETVNPGGSSLSYSATVDEYSYVWKTDKAWKGTCRLFVIKLKDGTEHLAKFKFK